MKNLNFLKLIISINNFLFILVFFLFLSCQKDNLNNNCSYNSTKGKLVVKGICMNYVIQILDNNIDYSLIEKEWIHEFTKETYKDVFRLGSVCNFPEYLNEGEALSYEVASEKGRKKAVNLKKI